MNDERTKIIQIDENTRAIVDLSTGEVKYVQHRVKDIWVQQDEKVLIHKNGNGKKSVGKKKHNTPTNPDFICVFRDNWNDLIRKKALTFAERGVLMSLIGFTDWRSNVLIDPDTHQVLNEATLATLIQCDRNHLSEHLAKLNTKGLIAIVKTGNRTPNKYMMNSNLSVFGKTLIDPAEHGVFDNTDWKPVMKIEFQDGKDHSKIKKK